MVRFFTFPYYYFPRPFPFMESQTIFKTRPFSLQKCMLVFSLFNTITFDKCVCISNRCVEISYTFLNLHIYNIIHTYYYIMYVGIDIIFSVLFLDFQSYVYVIKYLIHFEPISYLLIFIIICINVIILYLLKCHHVGSPVDHHFTVI